MESIASPSASLQPLGGARDRAVSRFSARLDAGAEARLYLNNNGKDGAGGRFASHLSRWDCEGCGTRAFLGDCGEQKRASSRSTSLRGRGDRKTLRMTGENEMVRMTGKLTGKPRQSAALCGVVAPVLLVEDCSDGGVARRQGDRASVGPGLSDRSGICAV
jgi:hypothetical protein